jgi:tetratricopeptide (TPR) repeat protein
MDPITKDVHSDLVNLSIDKHSSMPAPNLEQAIQQYANALMNLVQSSHTPTTPSQSIPAQILEVLTARDCVQVALENLKASADFSPLLGDSLEKLTQLDKTLREHTNIIAPFTQSLDWLSSFQPTENAWWWFLKVTIPFDWLWRIVTVFFLTISLGLLGDIAPRFLTGRPDSFAAIAVSFQSVFTLLAAGSTLTKSGQEALKQILKHINYPEKYWGILGAASTFLLMFFLIIVSKSLPQIATMFYTNPGIESYKKGDLNTAEEKFKRAIQLNADDTQAHFRLGRLYEDLQLPDQARPQYQIAIQGNIPEAINNLARLDIIRKDYGAAISLLEIEFTINPTIDPETKHAMFKNLGWARFEQKNYIDAETQLLEALNLESKSKFEPSGIAAVHCLLAKVMEAQGEKEINDIQGNKIQVLHAWTICLQANSTIQEQDEWKTMAIKRLSMEAHP